MPEKRPYEGYNGDNGSKKSRSNEESGAGLGNGSIQNQIAAIKARAAATKERADAHRGAPPPAPAQSPAEAARAKLEAMKARVAAATSRANTAAPPPRIASSSSMQAHSTPDESSLRLRGGLGIGLHPALLGDISMPEKKGKGSRFSTTMGNRAKQAQPDKAKKQLDLSGPSMEEIRKDPSYDPNVSGATMTARGRKSRNLIFNQKGKFIAQAAALRRQAQLEEMKRRIAESTKKAGLDEDRSEQAFLVAEPPKLEWWDEGLIDGDEYPDFEDAIEAEKKLKITTDDSVITRYIQHPVLLQPPQDKVIPPPKPMFMTKQEQAKKRRQDRTEIRKEKQARVRLGLDPPEAPKVKKSNLMRVLGDQAVKDPTAVEARVNREIAERAEKHEQDNEDRALTQHQRIKKLEANQNKDAAKGIRVCVFRIDSLAYGKHRYLIDVNAKQHAFTGITILHPRCNVVIVEGGQWSIAKYKKLMTQRIPWTEIAPPTAASEENERQHHSDIAEKPWLQPYKQDNPDAASSATNGSLRDHSHNRCILIWEGEEQQRAFKKWGSRVCETDAEARRALEKNKMENMWQLAKNWTE